MAQDMGDFDILLAVSCKFGRVRGGFPIDIEQPMISDNIGCQLGHNLGG